VSPYEILKTVRAAGFDPLAPPLREGTTYVLRATDFRGILMRVVVDARSGAIRDANRIVLGPGRYGESGLVPQPYGVPPYDPADLGAPVSVPDEGGKPSLLRPPAARNATHPIPSASPPLPRPRPSALASRKPADRTKSAIPSDTKPDAKPDAKSDLKSGATTNAPPAVSVVPSTAPAVVPLND
jgi:hypothetical protein